MSLWTRITEALAALAQGEGLAAVFEKLSTPPEKTVAFAIAVIALIPFRLIVGRLQHSPQT